MKSENRLLCKVLIRTDRNTMQGNIVNEVGSEKALEYLVDILEVVTKQAAEECRQNGCLVEDDLKFSLKAAMCYRRILSNYCSSMHKDKAVILSLYRDNNQYRVEINTSRNDISMIEIFNLYLNYMMLVLDINSIEDINQFLDDIFQEGYE